jgi:hypothetical protein
VVESEVTKSSHIRNAAVGPLSTRAHEAMEAFIRDQRDFGHCIGTIGVPRTFHLLTSEAKLIGAELGEMSA